MKLIKINLIFFLALLALHLIILLNIQFTAWPEMFSYPYLLNNGFLLYKDIALPYQPLLVLILGPIYKIFGYDLLVLKITTWTIILSCDIFIYLISKKLLNNKFNLLPLIGYIFLQSFLQGNGLWFDLGATPFILLSIYLFISLKELKKFFWLAFFLSLACLIKQQIGIVLVFIFTYLIFIKKWKESVTLLLGSLIPLIFIVLFEISQGVFNDYFFWSTIVPLVWYPKFPGYTHLPSRFELLETFILFGPGIFFGFINWFKLKDNFRIIFLIFLAVFFTALPRYEFFRFQEALAIYAILFIYLFNIKIARFLMVLGAAIVILVLLIRTSFGNIEARFYASSDLVFSKEISNLTEPQDKVYLLGVHSLNYILADRLPPKPWVDNYVWYMEIPGIQDKVINGFMTQKPKLVVWQKPIPGNWYDQGTYQPKKLVSFIENNYKKINDLGGGVEIWQRD